MPDRRWQVDGDHWLPLLLVFTTLVATTVFGTRPLISYLALSLGAGPVELGMIASSFAVLAIAGAIPLGRVIDRVGERPIMFAGAVVCGAVCGLLPAVDSIPLLALATAMLGIGQMMAVVGAHTMLASRGPLEKRAFRIGLYTSVASLGHAIGPGAAGIIIGDDVSGGAATVALLGAACVSAVAAIVALPLPGPVPHPTDEHGRRLRASALETLRLPGMVPALTAGVISLTAVDILVAYLPAYGEERAISPQMIGFALATLSLAQMTSRIGLGWLLDRFGHVAVLVGSMTLAAITIPVLIIPIGELVLLATMAIAGLGLGLAQPLTLVWVAIATPPASRGLAMGVRMGGNRFGQLLVPVAVGATAGQLGIGAILGAVAGLLAGAAGYVIRSRAEFINAGSPPAEPSAAPLGEP
jgi:MFS family permease